MKMLKSTSFYEAFQLEIFPQSVVLIGFDWLSNSNMTPADHCGGVRGGCREGVGCKWEDMRGNVSGNRDF